MPLCSSSQCNEKNVQKAFKKFGEIVDISLPRNETRQNSLKGFGFVQFATREEAVKAVEEGNGMKLNGRIIVVDLALPKFQFDTLMDAAKQVKVADGKETKESNDDDEKCEDEDEEEEDEEDEDEEESEDEDDEDDEDEESEDEDDMEVDGSDLSEGGSEDDESDSDDDKAKPKKAKTESHDTVEGRTIFLRNLLFETVEDEVKEWSVQFRPFGFLFSWSKNFLLLCFFFLTLRQL